MYFILNFICIYLLLQVYHKQCPQENELAWWQEIKNGSGIKTMLFDIGYKKSVRGLRQKRTNYFRISLLVSAQILQMLLIISGDVELNPGPLQGTGIIHVAKT